eukprot:Amastigsp_a1887_57.p5 type:complete len:116 gc:universal Amastigsp_a1887_57:661-314(-)
MWRRDGTARPRSCSRGPSTRKQWTSGLWAAFSLRCFLGDRSFPGVTFSTSFSSSLLFSGRRSTKTSRPSNQSAHASICYRCRGKRLLISRGCFRARRPRPSISCVGSLPSTPTGG